MSADRDWQSDEHYIEGRFFQIRSSVDRRYWQASGGKWHVFGVVDDYGNIAMCFDTHPRYVRALNASIAELPRKK